MFRYLKIFIRIYSARLGKDISLPIYLLTSTIGSLVFFFMHFFAFSLIIGRFTFTGWSIPELWVSFFTFEVFTYTAFFLFWGGIFKTVSDIALGKFDFYLIKPISPRFLTFVRGGGAHNLIPATAGIVVILVISITNSLPITFLSILSWLACFVISLWTFSCLTVLLVSINFKYGRVQGSASAVWQLQELWKYPPTAFDRSSFLSQFLALPLALIASMPAVLLLNKHLPFKFYSSYLILVVILTLASFIVWRRSLRHYSSANS